VSVVKFNQMFGGIALILLSKFLHNTLVHQRSSTDSTNDSETLFRDSITPAAIALLRPADQSGGRAEIRPVCKN
jgi:hypothetical protein